MTFPCVNAIQLVPTMQKKLFTLSFQPKFLKIWFTKVTASRSTRGPVVPLAMFKCFPIIPPFCVHLHSTQLITKFGHVTTLGSIDAF